MTDQQLDALVLTCAACLAAPRHYHAAECSGCGDWFASDGPALCPSCREWEDHESIAAQRAWEAGEAGELIDPVLGQPIPF